MLILNFKPFPVIQTKRLVMHAIDRRNAPEMFRLRSNPLAMKYIGKPLLGSVEDAEKLIDNYMRNVLWNDSITWALSLKGPKTEFIGTIGYHTVDKNNYRAEIGYMIFPEQWGKGLVSEALGALLDFGLDKLRLHSIEAKVNPENVQSINVLLKHGFVKEAYFRENYYFEGKFLDTAVYSLVRKE